MSTSDQDLRTAVLRELQWDPRTQEAAIDVEIAKGVVRLVGSVDSWAMKIAAQDAAHRVRNVLDVANDLQVSIPGANGRTDAEIAQIVRLALEWDVFVPDQRIRSSVSNGWVTLEGDVDYVSQRDDCERSVRNLNGVRGITNKISVAVPPVGESEVRTAIVAALARHAAREAHHVELLVEDGSVTLAGSVGSRAEHDAIVGAARGTAGVRTIHDRLRIEPYDTPH